VVVRPVAERIEYEYEDDDEDDEEDHPAVFSASSS
jgi:hypothetical protein